MEKNLLEGLVRLFKDTASHCESEQMEMIKFQAEAVGQATSYGNIGYFLLDYTKMQYLYWNDAMYKLLGFNEEQVLAATGFEFVVSRIEPRCLQMIPQFIDYAFTEMNVLQSGQERVDIFYDYTLTAASGKKIQLLQHSVPLSFDGEGKFACAIHFVYDLTGLKSEELNRAVIRNPEGQLVILGHDLDNKIELIGLLSDREKEVMCLLAENQNSKEIAHVLKISSHTVDVHRRSLLHKTGMKNTTALLTYARIVGLL